MHVCGVLGDVTPRGISFIQGELWLLGAKGDNELRARSYAKYAQKHLNAIRCLCKKSYKVYLTNDCIWHLLKIYIIYVGVVVLVVETLVFRMQIIINYKSLFHLLPVLSWKLMSSTE